MKTYEKELIVKKYAWRFVLAILFFGIIVLARLGYFNEYLSVTYLQQQSHKLQEVVAHHYAYAVFLFIAVYVLVVTFGVPLAALLTVASGFLFGTVWGALYSNIGATVGATLYFLIVRYVLGEYLQERYAQRLVTFNKHIEVEGARYLLMLHWIAFLPLFVVNTLAALTQIPLSTFVWTTVLGVIPASLIFSYAGKQFHALTTIQDIFSFQVVLALALLALFGIVSMILVKTKRNGDTIQ